MALLAQGVEARADDAEMLFSAGDGAQAARDFLFHLRHAYGTFAQVVRQRDRKVTDEEQHGVGMLPEAPQQIECNGLSGAPTLVVRRVRFRIALFALRYDGIVNPSEGGDVRGAERALLLSRRLA